MRITWTRPTCCTVTARGAPPFTDTEPLQPASQATERTTRPLCGARTRTASDLVVLDRTCSGSRRPAAVKAAIGTGARRKTTTTSPCEVPTCFQRSGTTAAERDPPSSYDRPSTVITTRCAGSAPRTCNVRPIALPAGRRTVARVAPGGTFAAGPQRVAPPWVSVPTRSTTPAPAGRVRITVADCASNDSPKNHDSWPPETRGPRGAG